LQQLRIYPPSLDGNVGQTEAAVKHAAQHLTDAQATGNCRGPMIFQDNTFGWGLLNLLQAVQSQ